MFLLLLQPIEIDSILNKFVLTAMFAQANFIEWCFYFRHLNAISKTSARITILPISLFSLPWKRGAFLYEYQSIFISISISISGFSFLVHLFATFFSMEQIKAFKMFFIELSNVPKYRKWIFKWQQNNVFNSIKLLSFQCDSSDSPYMLN